MNYNFFSSIAFFLFFFMMTLTSAQNAILDDHDKNKVAENGLIGEYYQGYAIDSLGHIRFDNLTQAYSRTDSIISFWNGDRYYRWEPVSGWGNNYSVNWTGYIYLDQPGQYGFGTMSDDGSQIFINDSLIVDNAESQWYDWEDNISEGDTSGTYFPPLILDSGYHEISIRFFENASYDGIELWWFKPGNDSSDIPYYGTTFHGTPPTYNPNTNWEIVPHAVLFTEIDTVTTNIYHDDQNPLKNYTLYPNFPNPFNPVTKIQFRIPVNEFVTIKIYDARGQEISTLVNQKLNAGGHTMSWNASNYASGIYYYKIQAGAFHKVRKMVVLK